MRETEDSANLTERIIAGIRGTLHQTSASVGIQTSPSKLEQPKTTDQAVPIVSSNVECCEGESLYTKNNSVTEKQQEGVKMSGENSPSPLKRTSMLCSKLQTVLPKPNEKQRTVGTIAKAITCGKWAML